MLSKGLYLDYNATSPVHPDLKKWVPEWLDSWGNPSSIHAHGRDAKRHLREARQYFANYIGAHPMEIIFTSGGSEANNTVIKGLLSSVPAKTRREIISTWVEHPSVLRTLEEAERQGFTVHRVPISRDGVFDMEFYNQVISDKTLLVTVMSANNETGTLFPIAKIAKSAKEKGAFVHTDAVQMPGRMTFQVDQAGVDFASFSGHKFYALKGVGVLYSRRGQGFENLIHGGGQERGRRAGTENVLAIASLGYMAKKIADENHHEEMKAVRDYFEAQVLQKIPQVVVTAAESKRLPNTSSLVIEGVNGESMLMSLDVKGFSVSTGAACSSGNPEPSHVLLAMGLTFEEAQSSLRISVGWMTTRADIDQFVEALGAVVQHLRALKIKDQSEGKR